MKLNRFGWRILILAACAIVASAQLTVSPSTLSFQAQGGGLAQPLDAVVSVVAQAPPASFTVKVDQPWVSLYNAADNSQIQTATVLAPANVIVRINNAPITPGTYQSTVSFYQAGTANAVAFLYITLTVVGSSTGNLVVTPSTLTFNYQSGGPFPLPQTLSVSSSNNSSIAFNVNSTTVTGGRWLSVGTNSSFTPSIATVAAVPLAGMPPGVYTGAVYVTPTSGGATQTIPVNLIVSTIGSLSASPDSLTFNYQRSSTIPPPQTVTVVNVLGGNVPYTISTTTASGGNWLSPSATGSSTPSSFWVSVAPAALAAGTYYGTVNIYPSGSNAPSSQIPVTLNVGSSAQLTASPAQLTYNYVAGSAAPPSQFISVTSTGAPVGFNAAVSGPAWVTLSAAQGTTPTAVSVLVNPTAGTAAGTYNAAVLLSPTSGGGTSVTVPITVNITPANYISASPTSLTFDYTLNGSGPAPQLVYLTSSGGSIRFDAVAATLGFGNWLTVSPSSQYTPGSVTVTVSAQGLAAGTYSGSISIISDAAINSPQTISVTFNVSKGITFSANPFGLSFSYQTGQPDPQFQAGLISSSGGTPLTFSLSSSTASGGGWLLAAGSGTTPGTIIAGISPNLLSPGTYSGTINVQPTDNTLVPLQVPVVLNVAAGPVFAPSTNQLTFQARIGGPVPAAQTMNIAATGSGTLVYAPTTKTSDGGQWLQASPTIGVTASNVSVTVNPAGLAAGQYYGVVVLSDTAGVAPAADIPVSLQVSSGPILTVAGQSLVFNATAGGNAATAQQITVGGNGNAVPYHADLSASWLQVIPSDGTTDGVLSVVATPTLAAGYYVATITISIPGVPGSQQYVPVVFVVH